MNELVMLLMSIAILIMIVVNAILFSKNQKLHKMSLKEEEQYELMTFDKKKDRYVILPNMKQLNNITHK